MSTLSEHPPEDAPLSSATGVKTSLAVTTRAELNAALQNAGVPAAQVKMRSAQLWNWIYARGAPDFDTLPNIAKSLRSDLSAQYSLERPQIAAEQISEDGTRKWLLRLEPQRP